MDLNMTTNSTMGMNHMDMTMGMGHGTMDMHTDHDGMDMPHNNMVSVF